MNKKFLIGRLNYGTQISCNCLYLILIIILLKKAFLDLRFPVYRTIQQEILGNVLRCQCGNVTQSLMLLVHAVEGNNVLKTSSTI